MGGFSAGFSAGFEVVEEEPQAPPTTPYKISGTYHWADGGHRPHRRP